MIAVIKTPISRSTETATRLTVKSSSNSSSRSSVIGTVIVCVVTPAAKFSVPAAAA